MQSKALDFMSDGIEPELRVAFLAAALGVIGWAYQVAKTGKDYAVAFD
jgi:hypothetical protein